MSLEFISMKNGQWLKRILAVSLLCIGFSFFSYADFSVEGHYQGKMIYVQSPLDDDGFGVCINRVSVNGDVIPVDTYSNAFKIDLSEFNYQIGDAVFLLFEHDEECHPKLINPEALRPKSTFVLQDISCTPEGVLTWSTTEENGKLNYLVEQYKWNKWVVIGEVTGEGTADLHTYSFNVLPHSGENTIRLAQIDNTTKKRVTQEIKFKSTEMKEPQLVNNAAEKTLEFVAEGQSVKTKFEIFDTYGNIVKKGYDSGVDYANMKPGVYYINYDNKNERIIIK